ncbi:uncharacterized protein [Nicotiana sylvestris]|uniref:Uncharacterized protein LOC104227122 n=2 Tax=Nicotiana TaxID=4085 RepID=A0A1U7WC79_NICSY|nr:PREDICTED: uncharacterized protein LOC104227122 [Nicotiana sylvestris]XP_016514527.1 PREDICTED: uncharacterized protein LOC107831285 [Nicotiana tabacum]
MAIAVESLLNEGASLLSESRKGGGTPFLGDERTLVLFESPVHEIVTEKPAGEPDSLPTESTQEPLVYSKPLESIPPSEVPIDEDDIALSAWFKMRKPAKETFEVALKKSKRSVKKKKKRSTKQGEFVIDKSIPVFEADEDTGCSKSKKVVIEQTMFEGDTVGVVSQKGKSVKVSRKQKRETVRGPSSMKVIPSDSEDVLKVYEDAVQNFYVSLFTVEGDHICVLVNAVDIVLDASALGKVLQISCEGISSVKGSCSANFRRTIMKEQAIQQGERVHKKALLPEYQLLFELINKVFLPRPERRSIASKSDLVLIEALDEFVPINMQAIMIEHMQKVANFKGGNYGLPYGFLLTRVFKFYKVPLDNPKVGTRKQTFSKTTLEECECVEKLSQAVGAPGFVNSSHEEVARLTKENDEICAKLLEEQLSANDRMDLVLKTLATSLSKSSSSSAP